MDVGILAYGGYIPKSRLQRAEIFKAHEWFSPNLKGLAKGCRAMANWDEDSVTMASEAARDCIPENRRGNISAVYMASTTFPFLDRQNAGIIVDALNLNSNIQTVDFASSLRAGTAGLIIALQASTGVNGPVLLTAADKRIAKAGSALEMTSGDGAAAFLLGSGPIVARFLGSHTESEDFIDHFRSEGSEYDYAWEERWVRDEGYLKIVPTAINALLEKAGVTATEITTFCFPAAARNIAASIAKKTDIPESAVTDNLQSTCGECGTAHALILLAKALETAEPGDKILVTSFGQGCDALLFEVTGNIKKFSPRTGIVRSLARGRPETNYNRFLAFNGGLQMEMGLRAEVDKNTGLTTHYRNRNMAQRMIGGKCRHCGTAQFPKSNICVNENCGRIDSQDDYPFAERTATLNSYTADRLTYSPDPPAYYGMIQFEEGGRLMSDFTDISSDDILQVGMKLRMVFRVKDYDTKRGFRRYFWKAVPVDTAKGG